ncbi:ATP-binding cassette domain-containing protein, partial [Erysipelothrix rhusiopathiae]|nr:ATP-binding cassette domain-containing protein [Erysipelothrix rhusiopathiae]
MQYEYHRVLLLDAQQDIPSQSLNLVGIHPDIWKRSPLDLSGGQKRRVAIAGVLATNPDVI